MKSLATSLLLFILLTSVHTEPSWEKKVIGNVRIEIPRTARQTYKIRLERGGAAGQYLRGTICTCVLDLELVFPSFPPGTGGNLDGAAANMSSQLKAASGEESLTPWKATTRLDARLDTSRRSQTGRMKQGK